MNTFFKMRYHRDLPNTYKFNQITIIKNHNKYYLAFSIIYDDVGGKIKCNHRKIK